MRAFLSRILISVSCVALCACASVRSDSASTPANPRITEIAREISVQRIEQYIRKLVSFETRNSLSETQSDTRGVGAARRWIKAEMERCARENGGRLRVEFDEFVAPVGRRIPQPTPIVNVVATLPGTQAESRERVYVVSGHYDSMASDPTDPTSAAPGANDDASGTAAVMELACVMSRHAFNATLVFMAVAGEEQGLLGSAHWARQARAKGFDIAGMITNDIIGNSKGANGKSEPHRVRLYAEGIAAKKELDDATVLLLSTGGENDSPTRQLARFTKEIAERHVPHMQVSLMYRRDRYLRGGDHISFLEQGYPAIRFVEPNEDYRHQHQNVREENGVKYGDLPEFVDFAYVANVTRVNAATLAALALGPTAPREVEMENIKLEYDTTLRWQANREPGVAGYRIVWRETTAPFWHGVKDVGNVTRDTLVGMSKDDWIFGVQAYDKDGNVSVAAYPKPYFRR